MPSPFTTSAVDSFMRGYSFIDDIRARDRQEEQLQQRLAEEREHRAFLREQATARSTRAEQTHAANLADRQARIERENRERAARAAIARGEDPSAFADTDIGASELIRLGRQDELVSDARAIQGLAAQQRPQGLSGMAAAQGQPAVPPPAPPTEPPIPGESQLGPSRGRDSLQQVALDEAGGFSEDPPGFLDRAGATIRETGRGLSVGAANLVNRALGEPPVEEGASFGAGITGSVAVPEAFTTEEEFATLDNPADVERARTRNAEIIANLESRAQNPSANTARRIQETGRELTAEARQAEFQTTQRYSNLLDPSQESSFRQLAAESPDAAVTQYFQDRATLNSADPDLRAAVDRQMQPVISQYEQTIQEEIGTAPVGSPERRRHTARLRNVQATARQIYDDYRPSKPAGINQRGMPVGNQELAANVTNELDSPDRPRPTTPLDPSTVRAAATTVNRVRPNTRLNDRQLLAVTRLTDAGLLTPGDAQSLLLTGQLPQSSLGLKLSSHSPEKDLWATDNLGNMMLIRPGRKTAKPGDANVSPNELTTPALDDVQVGLRAVYPEAGDEHMSAVTNMILNNFDDLSQRFDFRNQQSNIELGRLLGQTVMLNAAENHRKDNNWIPFDGFFEAPSPEEILRSPELQDKLAGRFEIQLQNMPEVRSTGVPETFDVSAARSFLASGDLGVEAQTTGESGSDIDVYQYIVRRSLLQEAANQQGE